MKTSTLCYSFRMIILIILRKYLYLSDIKATWKLNGCFAIIFVNSSKPTNITELGKLSAWRFCVHYCHVVLGKICGVFLFLFFADFWIPVYLFFAHKHKPLWYFCFIYFSQFCLFISLTDFWGKNKKWLIPVIVILAVIMVPLCIWWGIEDAKKEKKERAESREKQRLMNRQVKRIMQNQ